MGVRDRLRLSVGGVASSRWIPRRRPSHRVLRLVMKRAANLQLRGHFRQNALFEIGDAYGYEPGSSSRWVSGH